jgi:hypothetical protein
VGISENVGNFMMFKLLTDNTHKIIHHSNLCSARDPTARNLCTDPLNDKPPEVICSLCTASPALDHGKELLPLSSPLSFDDSGPSTTHDKNKCMAIIDPYKLMGHTLLMDTQDNGQCFHACIVNLVEDHQEEVCKSDDHNKFPISINDDQYEEVITYNELMDFIQKNEENDTIDWHLWHIVRHQGPLLHSNPNYNGSKFNVMVEWENGEIMTESLSVIATNYPIMCAIYAKEYDLLDTKGWKCFRNLAKREKNFVWQVKQAKLCSYHSAPKYKFSYQIQRATMRKP